MLYISCSCLLTLFQKLPKICKFREITVLKNWLVPVPPWPWSPINNVLSALSLVFACKIYKRGQKWRCTVKVIQYGWNDVLTAACNLYPLNVSSWLFFHVFTVLSIITIHTRVCWAYECIGQSEAFRWVIAETVQFHVKWLTGWLKSISS